MNWLPAIEEPLLLDEKDEPYTGPMGIQGNTLVDRDGNTLSLSIKGKMLATGAVLTSQSFRAGFGGSRGLGQWIVTISVFLFGLSTIISWSYYGDRCVEYLFGVKYLFFYRMLYVCFTCLGAVLALDLVWAYGDLAMGLMTVPNLTAVILLSPVIARITRDYMARYRKKA